MLRRNAEDSNLSGVSRMMINTNLEDEDEKITTDCIKCFYGGVFGGFCRCKDL
jgi:hypothetical protein